MSVLVIAEHDNAELKPTTLNTMGKTSHDWDKFKQQEGISDELEQVSIKIS